MSSANSSTTEIKSSKKKCAVQEEQVNLNKVVQEFHENQFIDDFTGEIQMTDEQALIVQSIMTKDKSKSEKKIKDIKTDQDANDYMLN
eukprot:CAMPEP_0116932300 /NCGR_PEP_ID=MMETSP0467-20121206/28346_1 /TAXON_ID=283647 /ORGANISM="Mesodinium pulex, Strain SPMC105" /LENGTH=87 /DNA_ID=CAMNT_0004612937 /DNA_START=1309 /DNA_END=1571 /DNA_ORIENTATION=-